MRLRPGRPDIARHSHRFSVPVAESGAPLTVTWLGVSTLLLDDGSSALMTDGFFSRPSLARVGLGKVSPSAARVDGCLARLILADENLPRHPFQGGSLICGVLLGSWYPHTFRASEGRGVSAITYIGEISRVGERKSEVSSYPLVNIERSVRPLPHRFCHHDCEGRLLAAKTRLVTTMRTDDNCRIARRRARFDPPARKRNRIGGTTC